MTNHIISMHTWVSLTQEQRHKMRAIFGIPRSSSTIVHDGRLESDGTTSEDFSHLTIQKMKDWLKNDSDDFHLLFDLCISKIQDEIEGKPIEEKIEEKIVDKPITEIKNAKKKK